MALAGLFYTVRFRRWSGPGLDHDELKTMLTAVLGKPKKATKVLCLREISHKSYSDAETWSHSALIERVDERQKPFLNSVPGLRDNQFAKL